VRGAIGAEGSGHGERAAFLAVVAEPAFDFVVGVLVHDRERAVRFAQPEEVARLAQHGQSDPASGVVVPSPHAGQHLPEAAARNAGLPTGLDDEAEALVTVELLPPQGEPLKARKASFLSVRNAPYSCRAKPTATGPLGGSAAK